MRPLDLSSFHPIIVFRSFAAVGSEGDVKMVQDCAEDCAEEFMMIFNDVAKIL